MTDLREGNCFGEAARHRMKRERTGTAKVPVRPCSGPLHQPALCQADVTLFGHDDVVVHLNTHQLARFDELPRDADVFA